MNDALLIIFGSVLAGVGGILGDAVGAWLEDRRELNAIKVSLADELGEIEGIINNMHEVFEQTKVFSGKYIE